ncbi:cytosolic endo-beta-N-acetylglucosaminidase-like [Amphiura filiformis]|uniref:cytosolic endo-beta-N-acetylglucosaminidase-like n=1 Tax=Amphiura filiformis TaxID=82378 RepID=UPI003B210054
MAGLSDQDVDIVIEKFQTKVSISEKPELGNHYEPNTSEPIAQPLRTLDEVLLWKPDEDGFNVATILLAKRTEAKAGKPYTLLCHDMMGGYQEDRFVQGVPKLECYRYYHWQYLDMFIYFSHYFVTIPPPSWTNAAHKNGTLMLGTVITEWNDGAERCKQVFASESAYKTFADKLVAIAKYYKFDGWLVNIENPIAATHMPQMVGWVEYLTKEMHTHLPGSKVIWYDSVIIDGSLKWQDMLNDNNRVFFDISDGMFLNYTWNEAKLKDSVKNAGERKYDVFVGVDVFGRNCFGGGGWNTNKAMSVIRSNNLSAAIFAPGWVMEKLGREQFITNQNKYWGILDDFLPTHGVSSLPFVTYFCRGYGEQGFRNGTVALVKSWCNLSAQQIQPTFLQVPQDTPDGKTGHQSMDHCVKDGFNGGGSLLLRGTLGQGQVHPYRIFETGIVPSHQLLVSYTVKCCNAVDACVYLDLGGDQGRVILWTSGESAEDKQPMSAYGLRESEQLDPSKLPVSKTTAKCTAYAPLKEASHKNMQDIVFGCDSSSIHCIGWQTRHYLLPTSAFGEGSKIEEMGVLCFPTESDPPKMDYMVRIGELKIINPDSLKNSSTQVSNLTMVDDSWHNILPHITNVTDQASFCCTLKWDYPYEAMHYDVYVSGVNRDPNHNRDLATSEVVFIGRAYANLFRVCHLLAPTVNGKEGQLEFKVQPSTQEGFVAPLAAATRIRVAYS